MSADPEGDHQRQVAPMGLYSALCAHDEYDILRAVTAWLDQHDAKAIEFVSYLRARWRLS